ncbi:unnamed protein product [Bursaphelenchus okinawaensis]|uniref:Protein kinase domain-containing protein n=1 Tax=Bursaphelenchus okinawaensis TaxID=465554 RepID=A0A811KAK4_9BILA|nr:unnamed protein product [Bursaphelenchus okinawaensis]CAG9096407.1 unnamed protein product [Bursaphelenchus okinawaensis]
MYVFELPPKVVYELGDVLDGGNLWEEIAQLMPDIKTIDIEGCRRTEKPTESLLRVWGSKGYKVLDLFKVFGRCQFVRCVDLLKPYVDPKFHNITMSTEKSILSPRSTFPNESVNKGDNTQPSTVYSKRAQSQIEPLLLSEGDSVQSSNEIFSGLHTIPAIKYEDIQDMTNNFAVENVCGKGGYGVVYRGMWKHMPVAVKRIQARKGGQLEHQKERIRQSLQELRHLSKLRHDNILSLYGYSMDGPEPCLLYQFMPSGSLEDRIINENEGKNVVSYSTVTRWFAKFRVDDEKLEDKPRAGRPSKLDKDALRRKIEDDPHITIRELEELLNCGKSTIGDHLKAMGMVKKLDKWVPHNLTDLQKAKRRCASEKLLQRCKNEEFLDRIVTIDEKWISFNNTRRSTSWCKRGEAPKHVPKPELH